MTTASSPANRYRRGEAEYCTMPTPASTQINPGDFIFNNSGVAGVATAFTWTSNLATTQANFRQVFVGVAVDMKLASDPGTQNILILTKGQFAYPCAALGGALAVGALVGPDKDTGNNLLNQQVVNVGALTAAIGTLVEDAAVGATLLSVYLQSFEIYSSLLVSA